LAEDISQIDTLMDGSGVEGANRRTETKGSTYSGLRQRQSHQNIQGSDRDKAINIFRAQTETKGSTYSGLRQRQSHQNIQGSDRDKDVNVLRAQEERDIHASSIFRAKGQSGEYTLP
jgi:hypothetical protein